MGLSAASAGIAVASRFADAPPINPPAKATRTYSHCPPTSVLVVLAAKLFALDLPSSGLVTLAMLVPAPVMMPMNSALEASYGVRLPD